jgi:hypothetical protein
MRAGRTAAAPKICDGSEPPAWLISHNTLTLGANYPRYCMLPLLRPRTYTYVLCFHAVTR